MSRLQSAAERECVVLPDASSLDEAEQKSGTALLPWTPSEKVSSFKQTQCIEAERCSGRMPFGGESGIEFACAIAADRTPWCTRIQAFCLLNYERLPHRAG